ncbi:MAG: hypothetical protein WAV23_01970 [Minisyncoccia bacterium]
MKRNNAVFPEIPVFKNKENKNISLTEIVKKNIISVKIGYLSEKKKVKAEGFMGRIGFKKNIQEKRELIINDPRGITFSFDEEAESAVIFFSEKKEFEKLADYDFDYETILKREVITLAKRYQIIFPINNLKEIDWIDNEPLE